LALDPCNRIDPNNRFLLPVTRVKMRRRMIIVVHRYDHSEKPAYLGHCLLISLPVKDDEQFASGLAGAVEHWEAIARNARSECISL
jgi:hypothetical protein